MLNSLRPRPVYDVAHSLIRGIPGIGKSSFGLYCLWRLVKESRHVHYDYPKGLAQPLRFGTGTLQTAVYIADGVAPRLPAAVQLLVPSPHQNVYHEFKKSSLPLFMPEPTNEEMLLMRQECFPGNHVDDTTIADRILRWGNVPCFVFELKFEKLEFERTISSMNANAIRSLVSRPEELEERSDVSCRLVHYAVDGYNAHDVYRWPRDSDDKTPRIDFGRESLRFATHYVTERLWTRLARADYVAGMRLLRDLFADPEISKFSGSLWQKWASYQMEAGKGHTAFKIRRLTVSDISQGRSDGACVDEDLCKAADRTLGIMKSTVDWLLPLHTCTTRPFDTAEDLARLLSASVGGAPVRFIATPHTFAAIDFWGASGVGSNATLSRQHDLVVQGERLKNGWRAIAEAMGIYPQTNNPLIQLWLVPPHVYPLCKPGSLKIASIKTISAVHTDAQRAVNTEFNAAVDRARSLQSRIVQYVVEIPLPQAHWA